VVAAATVEVRRRSLRWRVRAAATVEARRRRRSRPWRVRPTMALAAALVVEARRVLAARVRLARLSPRPVSWSRRARRP
jgi:hypothetical protein